MTIAIVKILLLTPLLVIVPSHVSNHGSFSFASGFVVPHSNTIHASMRQQIRPRQGDSWIPTRLGVRDPNGSDDDNDTEQERERNRKKLEADIANKLALSIAKEKAISALSKRKGASQQSSPPPSSSASSDLPAIISETPTQQTANLKNIKSQRKAKPSANPTSDASASASASSPFQPKIERNKPKPKQRTTTKTSLLPPPLANLSDDDLTSGLSSWEEFLGQTSSSSSSKNNKNNNALTPPSLSNPAASKVGRSLSQLPNIRDLFPPTNSIDSPNSNIMAASKLSPNFSSSSSASAASSNEFIPPMQGMDGVLPVSELFYRSSQSLSQEPSFVGGDGDDTNPNNNNNNNNNVADDEELPFSAEQSDSLVSEDGRVQIRRNQAAQQPQEQLQQQPKQLFQQRRSHSRKMVRRGMEMLVGGVPINVDPPQRSVELSYQFDQMDWTQVIGLNTRDFGPLLHQGSAKDVTEIERGLYCESFVHSAIKWDVCPKDLLDIVKNHHVEKSSSSYASLLDATNDLWDSRAATLSASATKPAATTASKIPTFLKTAQTPAITRMKNDAVAAAAARSSGNDEVDTTTAQDFLEHPDMPFEYEFEIQGISKDELESITDPVSLERTILRTIVMVVQDKLLVDDFNVEIDRLIASSSLEDETTTLISIKFHFEAEGEEEDIMPIAQSIKPLLTQAINDGSFCEAMAEAAAELGWFEEVVDEISEEWVIVSRHGGKQTKRREPSSILDPNNADFDVSNDGTFGNEIPVDDDEDAVSDLFLGGGNDGVFFDYSDANRENAPFQGNLGPLLLDAAIERAKQRYPRVIAIGDVHGCIDELQDLLRLCDYQPGDLVCFLGDLVCKGPDSISVVQMAREIGAIGIRGNHDFEVVRWYQAIQSGVDPPVVGSEHFHIASCLSKADMKWLYSLPWYISSKDLGALFVHAGFVAGIRLAKQNPRLMMNMRSILPDGTVTSKFFSNWPWARLWDGPQTVLFGHDADRGLQQYEHAIGLDTGCVYGGRLTACILPEKRLVSVNARREYFKYRRRHYD